MTLGSTLFFFDSVDGEGAGAGTASVSPETIVRPSSCKLLRSLPIALNALISNLAGSAISAPFFFAALLVPSWFVPLVRVPGTGKGV